MKKHLIALAVAGAVAAPAMAQNVTVYGILDKAMGAIDTGAATANSFTGATSSILSSERIGFRGTEDLGGGMKAFFAIESGNTSNATVTFSRAAHVGLSGSFGTVKLGTIDMNTTNLDDAVSQMGNFSANPTDSVTAANSATVDALGNDQNNGFSYTTPTIGGFNVEVATARANSGAASATDFTSVVLSYANGPMKAYYGSTTQDGAGAAKLSLATLAAAYDMGMFSVGISNTQFDDVTSSDVKKKVTNISWKVPLANGLAIGGFYGIYKDSTTANGDGKGLGVIVTKDLSKRTTGYAGYNKTTNQAGAAWSTRGQTLDASPAGTDPSALLIGVRHTF